MEASNLAAEGGSGEDFEQLGKTPRRTESSELPVFSGLASRKDGKPVAIPQQGGAL